MFKPLTFFNILWTLNKTFASIILRFRKDFGFQFHQSSYCFFLVSEEDTLSTKRQRLSFLQVIKRLWSDGLRAYSNSYTLKWSLWVVISTCVNYQVNTRLFQTRSKIVLEDFFCWFVDIQSPHKKVSSVTVNQPFYKTNEKVLGVNDLGQLVKNSSATN